MKTFSQFLGERWVASQDENGKHIIKHKVSGKIHKYAPVGREDAIDKAVSLNKSSFPKK